MKRSHDASGSQKKRIGYTCPYIPVEILSATGLKPYCLLHGSYELMQEGTKYARIDACPLVRANIAHVLEEADQYALLVGSTGCDMSRRFFDIIGELTDIPILLLHMPRTDKYQIYSDEIDWMITSLDKMFDVSLKNAVSEQIDFWETARTDMRTLDKKRYLSTPECLTSEFHKAARSYYQGMPDPKLATIRVLSDKPRVYLLGSEFSYENGAFLELLEQEIHIIGDHVCGLSQFVNIHIRDHTIEGIKSAYYNQTPCMYRRPNQIFYDHVKQQIDQRSCKGIIGLTLDYCDPYEFELLRMEKVFGLPLLRVRTDYAGEKISQLRTRIAAFGEMLCSMI